MEIAINDGADETVLIDQVFVKAEDGKTVAQLLQDAVASMGENIQVGRFERIEVGV